MSILKSKRLVLRNMSKEDFPFLYEKIFTQYNVVQHTFGSELLSYKAMEELLFQIGSFKSNLGLSTLVQKDTQEILGLAGVMQSDYLDSLDYEIGFILKEEAWKKGYAKEIGEAQINYVQNILRQKRVLALAKKDNMASIHTLYKLGFEYFKTIDTKLRGKRELFIKIF